jgi:predicted ATP-dependent serine protease
LKPTFEAKRTKENTMSIATMILGESGTGKSTSLRNMKASDVLLIQAIKKPLPFRSSDWKHYDKERAPNGNIHVLDESDKIIHAMKKTKRKIIVIDDFQYILANEFMRRSAETGFTKFTEIGKHAWDILVAAAELEDDVRVYILAHTETTDTGKVKAKTIGKMLDEKITLEGMLTIVLRTCIVNGNFLFSTQNNGNDTVKSPMGLFDDETIENDLAAVDAAIQEYYSITA